jgi:hypothetical protein
VRANVRACVRACALVRDGESEFWSGSSQFAVCVNALLPVSLSRSGLTKVLPQVLESNLERGDENHEVRSPRALHRRD